MKKSIILSSIGLLVATAVPVMTGCNFTPDLNKTAAAAMIQAEYDHRPAEKITFAVNDMGLKQGLNAKLWKLAKVYPNNRWADYVLTDEGKKALTLQGGGDVFQWRPEGSNNDFHFFAQTAQSVHLKVKDVGDPQDDVVPGVDTARVAPFNEVENFEGIPDPVQVIAHNSINKVSSRRQAEFALVSGNWTLHSIK